MRRRTRWYKDVDMTSLGASATNRGQGRVLGRLLWLSVETVVILHETMHQIGTGNEALVSLLQRLHVGKCDNNDYSLLSSRTLGVAKMPEDNLWDLRVASVVVMNNSTRDAVNQRAAESFAERTGSPLHWYHAADKHQKCIVTDPAFNY